ncbi:hypothetical protein F5B22DRAFT_638116 [Xylaria bambusicola]|uniref:uncharacterized protein n=1 Tax=Xylaria bambusicola TaxID=326684 RepID=UPI002007E275|nr:uncharacterized protein F5B22DRAFT_638116 [Xylaria bambusicola]KAI0509291.1 hypothetical protein F5B22DRAFT_638116 [Xylaria bambusicola]
MAEAQEQPQAQPQPEPASAVAEEPVHALPPVLPKSWPELSSPHPSQASSGQDKSKEAQTWAPTPPEADTNASQQQERIRQSPNPQPPDAARRPEIGTTQESEKEPSQEKGLEDQGYQLQQDHVSDGPISESTSTSTPPPPPPPPISSSALVTEETTVATDQSKASITPTSPSTSVGRSAASRDQQKEQKDQDRQKEKHGATGPSPETMSHNPPHIPGTSRQPLPYSTPSTYATGGMSNTHYGYANTAPQAHDPYRAGPHATTNNTIPLPSMRTFDQMQQQPQQQQQHMAMSIPVSPVPPVPGQQSMYYGQQVPMGGMGGNPYASLSPEAMGQRYALPPGGPGAVLQAGRHKKRRTKTGCLTCRKRRIKCDELHPTCKNCQKSKRECLGYDPIFKNQQQNQQQQQQQQQQPQQSPQQSHQSQTVQQSHHATSNLHSTQNSATPTSASSTSSLPHSAPSVSASASTPLTPSTTASYTAMPSGIPSAAPPPAPTYSPGLASLGTSVSNAKGEGHPYHTMDHSLDSVLTPSSMSTSHFPATTPVIPHVVDYRVKGPPHLRGGGPSFVPLHSTSSHAPQSPFMERSPAYTGISVRKMKVRELVVLGSTAPPPIDAPLSQDKLVEVHDLYEQVYAPGLEKFFESDWYLKPYGPNALASNERVQEVLAAFLQSLSATTTNDVAGMSYSANLEFRVVWELAILVYSAEFKVNMSHGLPPTDDGNEVRNRVAVFETLLAGDFLDHNPLRPPLEHPDNSVYHRNRELRFWHSLAEFLLIRDQPGMDVTPQRDVILAQLRELLDGRENRDVLYSLTVIRALTHKFPPDFESTLPPHLDESDPKSKLAVARKFILDEARVTGGTTNVVRRFAELGQRAFINPACNIAR